MLIAQYAQLGRVKLSRFDIYLVGAQERRLNDLGVEDYNWSSRTQTPEACRCNQCAPEASVPCARPSSINGALQE